MRADQQIGVERRMALAAGALVTIVAGLVVTVVGRGAIAGAVGDGLYAVLVYLLVAVLSPSSRKAWLATTAFAVCAAIELLQRTGLPAQLVEAWAPLRYLLGTTFNAPDLVFYAAGAAAALLLDVAVSRAGPWSTGFVPPDA